MDIKSERVSNLPPEIIDQIIQGALHHLAYNKIEELCRISKDVRETIKRYFKARLKPEYRDTSDPINIYHRNPAAVTEKGLSEHPWFESDYRALKKAEEEDCLEIVIEEKAIDQNNPTIAMIAVSCLSFRRLLISGANDSLMDIVELAKKYPVVRQYILRSDLKKDYLKDPKYLNDIKAMAEIDPKFALESLQDISIKASILTGNHPAYTILSIIQTLDRQVDEQSLGQQQISDVLELIKYILADREIQAVLPEGHFCAQIIHTIQNKLQKLHDVSSVEQALRPF